MRFNEFEERSSPSGNANPRPGIVRTDIGKKKITIFAKNPYIGKKKSLEQIWCANADLDYL